MTIAVLGEADVKQVPKPQPLKPMALDRVTAPHEAVGVPDDQTPTEVLQARELADRHPDSVAALVRLAQAEMSIGNTEQASDAARLALLVSPRDPHNKAARIAATVILSRAAPESASEALADIDDPVARVNWAGFAVNDGEFDIAIQRLKGVDSASAHALRGFCLVSIQEYASAVHEYRAARKAGRESIDVLINMGYALAQLGAIKKAIVVTAQATNLAPKNTVASYNLNRYLTRDGQLARARAELDRLAESRPRDGRVALLRAWSHVDGGDGTLRAIRFLSTAKQSLPVTDSTTDAEVSASIAYLKNSIGRLDLSHTRRELWRALRVAGYKSNEIARMLVSVLKHRNDESELKLLIAEAGETLHHALLLHMEAKLAFLRGEVDVAVRKSEAASAADPANDFGTAATAAYLVGEVDGDYRKGAEILGHLCESDQSPDLTNNYAFCLALSGEPRKALRLLRKYPVDALSYHGATLGLALLASGEVADGMRVYDEAAQRLRDEGDRVAAGCVAARAGLALRELAIDHPYATSEYLKDVWPEDSGDPRVPVLARVATRVGVPGF